MKVFIVLVCSILNFASLAQNDSLSQSTIDGNWWLLIPRIGMMYLQIDEKNVLLYVEGRGDPGSVFRGKVRYRGDAISPRLKEKSMVVYYKDDKLYFDDFNEDVCFIRVNEKTVEAIIKRTHKVLNEGG